jgi:hypothetical protein
MKGRKPSTSSAKNLKKDNEHAVLGNPKRTFSSKGAHPVLPAKTTSSKVTTARSTAP